MKRKGLIILLIITIIFSFLLISLQQSNSVSAQESCPPNIDPASRECLNYLREQINLIHKQQEVIQKQLKKEEYQQLSLQEKINYINNQVTQTEREIKELQIEIATTDVEISLLENEIKKYEDSISLLKQEINVLGVSVNNRITESYKFSFVNIFDIFLDTKNISSVLRRSKYLAATRNKDKEALEQHASSVIELGKEEAKLQESKTELEVKKEVREEEKEKLAEVKQSLDSQKKERESLLAQSRVKEAQLLATFQQNAIRQKALDQARIDYIGKYGGDLVKEGHVNAGDWIGNMGNTGLSTGPHLHFSMKSTQTGNPCAGDIYLRNGYFTGGTTIWLGGAPYIHMYAGSMRLPIAGPIVLMTPYPYDEKKQEWPYEHQGQAIDLTSRYSDYSLNTGAPIYAVMGGYMRRKTDGYGGEYVYIHHTNGWASCYLHLQKLPNP